MRKKSLEDSSVYRGGSQPSVRYLAELLKELEAEGYVITEENEERENDEKGNKDN